MAIHKPYDRYIICPPHAKLADVDSLLLQEGQIAIYDIEGEQTENGLKAITNFKGRRKDEQRYEIRVGRNEMVKSRISDDKSNSTTAFAIDEIIDVYASAPKESNIKVDEVIFGYNGIDDGTEIKARKGDRIPVHIKLTGRLFELRGYPRGELFIDDYILFDSCPGKPDVCTECDPCEEVDVLAAVLDFIKRVKNQPVAGGGKVGDYIEIKPIHFCDSNPAKEPVEIPMNFYCIEMCDTGDAYALTQLKAAYPGLDIKRVGRNLSTTKYQVMKQGAKPANYTQKLSSIMKGCEDCPSGYTEVEGGIIYAVTLEDDGIDQSTVVESLEGAVAGTAIKADAQNNGIGMYTVAVSKKLTNKQIETFVEANPTAKVTYVATTKDMCSNPTISTVAWTACGSCTISKEAYSITLPDDECGNTAKEELQEAFPYLKIDDYGAPGGCQHKFKTTVITNMVCEECDPIFKDFYVSKAPESYRGRNWKRLGAVAGDDTIIADPLPKNCKVGVLFRGIDYLITPSDCLIDDIAFEEGSVRIAVQGGYPDEQREAISTYYNPIHTEYKSHWAPRTHMGGHLLGRERESRMYFDFRQTYKNVMERTFTNEETRLVLLQQYADFSFTINPKRYSNGFGRTISDHITFHFYVPYGAHEGIQELMDMLAASANIKPCKV
nr:MAG TPA: hypothetical protein [Caudoviricetes sp.]